MATNGKKVYNFGAVSLRPYTNFESKTLSTAAAVNLNLHVKNAQLVVSIDTGDATAAGDDGRINSLGREMYELNVEFFRSRATAGAMATLGLTGTVDNLRSSLETYYQIKLSDERASGTTEATCDVVFPALTVIDFDATAADASTMSLTPLVQGKVSIANKA